jgi:hypothetical protein
MAGGQATYYLFPRFDALSGLIFFADSTVVAVFTWVARLQFPLFHFAEGSGQAEQNQPVSNSLLRPHPWQASTITWHFPPL